MGGAGPIELAAFGLWEVGALRCVLPEVETKMAQNAE